MASRRVPIDPDYAPLTAAAIYTCPAAMKAEVTHFNAVNTNASTTYELTVHRVPSGGTATDEEQVARRSLIAGRSDIIFEIYNMILEAGDAIYVSCGTADEITVSGSVREFTE